MDDYRVPKANNAVSFTADGALNEGILQIHATQNVLLQ